MVFPKDIDFEGFPSMPNFRPVYPYTDKKKPKNTKYVVFRSSRPDYLTESEVKRFESFGIKSIIDFRAVHEYTKATGNKLLDSTYAAYKVKIPDDNYKPGDKVQYSTSFQLGTNSNKVTTGSEARRHFLVNFFRMNYVSTVYKRGSWFLRIFSLFYLLMDLVAMIWNKGKTNFTNFVGIYAKHVINPAGLIQQYKDMVDMSHVSICAVLKLMTEPENLPCMINCSHGKDRAGIITALVLSIMGRDREYILWDYELSAKGIEPMKDRLYKELVVIAQLSPEFTKIKAETMSQLLDYLEETYGSIPNYLESIGFSRAEQELLKRNIENASKGDSKDSDDSD